MSVSCNIVCDPLTCCGLPGFKKTVLSNLVPGDVHNNAYIMER